jgi:hypothetical protein
MRGKSDQSEWFKLAYLINCKPFSQQKVAQKAAMCSLDMPRDDTESSYMIEVVVEAGGHNVVVK